MASLISFLDIVYSLPRRPIISPASSRGSADFRSPLRTPWNIESTPRKRRDPLWGERSPMLSPVEIAHIARNSSRLVDPGLLTAIECLYYVQFNGIRRGNPMARELTKQTLSFITPGTVCWPARESPMMPPSIGVTSHFNPIATRSIHQSGTNSVIRREQEPLAATASMVDHRSSPGQRIVHRLHLRVSSGG